MNKSDAYWHLVMDFHWYDYNRDLYVFLADSADRMRKKGCPPQLCASILHMAILNAAIPACERKE